MHEKLLSLRKLKMEEPKVCGGIICVPRVISGWQALCYRIWVEAYRSNRREHCVYKNMKHDIFDSKRLTCIEDIAASEYGQWLADYLFIELELESALVPYDCDPDSAAESLWHFKCVYEQLSKRVLKCDHLGVAK
jgi:hypothetical protein